MRQCEYNFQAVIFLLVAEVCTAQPARYQLNHLSQTFSWLLGTGEEGCLPDS